jgi:23S rRNA pseudouridine1911/1915/1917 synthase
LSAAETDGTLEISLGPDATGRLDRALALAAAPQLSRARIQALMTQGAVSRGAKVVTDPSQPAGAGLYRIRLPPPAPAIPAPERIALDVLYEDEHLIVVDKPAGMAAHPAPGTRTGTLVNALIAHCGGSLSGVGGVARPGIVHRLDKGTTGLIVAAKTDAAHRGLAALFERRDVERSYVAYTRGSPTAQAGMIGGRIGRSSRDRKKMSVVARGGRAALTRFEVMCRYGQVERPPAARLRCVLGTGRTHQIRVHLAHAGWPVLADPTYGSGPPAPAVRAAITVAGLERQALHAGLIGFAHPITGARLRFESPLPEDLRRLEEALELI